MGLFKPKGTELRASTLVGVTFEGRASAEQMLVKGGSLTILAYVAQHAPCSMYSISEFTGIDLDELKVRVKMMVRAGFLRVNVGGEDGAGSVLGRGYGGVPLYRDTVSAGQPSDGN